MTADGFWKKHMDKVGLGGSVFTALCCLGLPALVSFLGAIGLGFLINDAILIPLLVVFLIVTLGGLLLGVRHHHHRSAFILGAVSAVVLLVFITIAFNRPLIWLGIAGLIIASILNVWFRVREQRRRPI